ncbi:MAG: YggL family protein [Planctomycetes bacterium]|nr:YggL family protein [Planctomycetota bacterium]MCH9725837.1 YggL family protein [Planctomycetota bacterium]MCH9775401.1 YggL family protein [Planctomycetota bacterium]
MRKRLRKKKHLGEFKAWGTSITIKRTTCDDFDPFLDDFIEQAIEGNHCFFGGGGMDDSFEGIIQLGTISNDPEERLIAIKDWLDRRADVDNYVIGKLIDLWYCPSEELDSV